MSKMKTNPLAPSIHESSESLPGIGETELFQFECGPDSPCYNRCCADVAIPLTPYDVARIRRNLEISCEDFLNTFTEQIIMPETGISLPMLKMLASPDSPCPFVNPAGCLVYEDRPGACRSWPIGRASSLGAEGIRQRYFLIREDYCQGFCSKKKYTPLEWQIFEGMSKDNFYNDLYMRFLSKIHASGKALDRQNAGMCFLCLYQLDRFRELIIKMGIFSRLEIDGKWEREIMENSASGDEACLDFALKWLELAFFGHCDELRKKD